MAQDGPDLAIVVRTPAAQSLARGHTTCASVAVAGRPARRRVCAIGGRVPTVRVRVADEVRTLPGAAPERLGPRAMRLRVAGSRLRLRAGMTLVVRAAVRVRPGPGAVATSGGVALPWRPWHLAGCAVTGPTSVRRGPDGSREVGLSFDDGPGPYTSRILRLLAAYDARATFFVVGGLVPGQAPLARRILGEGHMIGNQSWEHAYLPRAASIARTEDAVAAATGFRPCAFRPPYGAVSARLLADVRSEGLRTVLWSVDTNDWRRPGAAAIAAEALTARGGDIVLMHDGGGDRAQTVAATAEILAGLRRRGLRGVAVETLLGYRPVYRYGD